MTLVGRYVPQVFLIENYSKNSRDKFCSGPDGICAGHRHSGGSVGSSSWEGVQLKKENDIKFWVCVRFLVFVTND